MYSFIGVAAAKEMIEEIAVGIRGCSSRCFAMRRISES
jgi:hypothetical protein